MNRSRTAMVTTSTGRNGFVVLPGMAWPKSADNISRAASRSISKAAYRRASTMTRKARRGLSPRWSSARCVSWAVRGTDRGRPQRNTGNLRRALAVADRKALTTSRFETLPYKVFSDACPRSEPFEFTRYTFRHSSLGTMLVSQNLIAARQHYGLLGFISRMPASLRYKLRIANASFTPPDKPHSLASAL